MSPFDVADPNKQAEEILQEHEDSWDISTHELPFLATEVQGSRKVLLVVPHSNTIYFDKEQLKRLESIASAAGLSANRLDLKDQPFSPAPSEDKLAVDNDRLRVELAAHEAENAQLQIALQERDTKIRGLEARLAALREGVDETDVPPTPLPVAFRMRARAGGVRPLVPFAHPDDLATEDE